MSELTPIQIIHQGAVLVTHATIDYQDSNSVGITVVFETRHVVSKGFTNMRSEPSVVWFIGCDRSWMTANGHPNDEETGIWFTAFPEWDVYCVDATQRDSKVVLIRRT